MLCSRSTSRVRSATSCETLPRAAPPKMMRVLRWPVRPKGRSWIGMHFSACQTLKARSTSGGFAQQTFDDHRVAPLSVELAVIVIHADLAETDFAAQTPTRAIFGKDPRHELPEASVFTRVDQPQQGRLCSAGAAGGAIGVHRELGYPGVALA